MEYQVKIYRPGNADDDACLKLFTSTAPFLPIRVGDLLNPSTWGEAASSGRLLRVRNIEHLISEKSAGGIDPSGTILHKILVYTERIADTAESRNRMLAAS
jgi:hypothetical protein